MSIEVVPESQPHVASYRLGSFMDNLVTNHSAMLVTTEKYREGLVDMAQVWLKHHKTCGGERSHP